jgi:hypothetical protein
VQYLEGAQYMRPPLNNFKPSGRVGARLITQQDPALDARLLSRRTFLRDVGLVAAAMGVLNVPGLLRDGWINAAQAAASDLVRDTLNGLVAFIVPGPDAHSVHQGVSTTEPGGIDANIADILIESLDQSVPFSPQFSATVAAILNDVAQQIHAVASGPFSSLFARLSFPEKAMVFAVMESIDPLKGLAGVLPAVVSFLAYSEAGVFDPHARTLTGHPIGWTISNYEGVANGRNDFKGYFQNRRRVHKRSEDDHA